MTIEHLLAVAYGSRLEITRQKMLQTSVDADGRDWARELHLHDRAGESELEYDRSAITRDELFRAAKVLASRLPPGTPTVTTSELTDVCDFLQLGATAADGQQEELLAGARVNAFLSR